MQLRTGFVPASFSCLFGALRCVKAVTQMDEVMQRNAALVEQAAAAAVSMREQAHGLVESVAAFQVA